MGVVMAAVTGGISAAIGIGGMIASSQSAGESKKSSNAAIGTAQDFINSGDYDPGGSVSHSESQGTSNSSSSNSSGSQGSSRNESQGTSSGSSFSNSQQGSSGSSWSEGGSQNTAASQGQGTSQNTSYGTSQSGYNVEAAQGMMTEFEATFGGVEENLVNYYQNLDPVKYATRYKTSLNANIDKQLNQMQESMAAKGIMTSGMMAQQNKEASFEKARGGAEADLMAEDKVNEMKQGFLNTGDNRRNMYENAITGQSSESMNTGQGTSQNTSESGSQGTSFSGGGSVNDSFGNSVSGSVNEAQNTASGSSQQSASSSGSSSSSSQNTSVADGSSTNSNLGATQMLVDAQLGKAANESADAAGYASGASSIIGAGLGFVSKLF